MGKNKYFWLIGKTKIDYSKNRGALYLIILMELDEK